MQTLTQLLPRMRHDASVEAFHHNAALLQKEGRSPKEAQAVAAWAARNALKREREEAAA